MRTYVSDMPVDHPTRQLRDMMSGMSGICYCAGWMADTEEAVWRLGTGRADGWGDCTGPIAGELAVLAAEAIVAYGEKTGYWIAGFDVEYGGEWFVPYAEWEAIMVKGESDG